MPNNGAWKLKIVYLCNEKFLFLINKVNKQTIFNMKKHILTALMLAAATLGLSAEDNIVTDEEFLDPSAVSVQDVLTQRLARNAESLPTLNESLPHFGGYVIGSYKFDDAAGSRGGDGFGLRLIRLYVDGTVFHDFKYRVQLEVNGSPHVKDATLEWVHWKWLQVKVGQFKRAFTFENPYNPWDVGFGDYSQAVKKFAGFGDRVGEASMGGRDLGLQLQGDLLPSKRDGHSQLHYQLAMYNGQGINQKDRNRQKDFIGTIQWSPVKNLWIGAFGWKGNWFSADKGISVDRNRLAVGLKYEEPRTGISARAEYVRSWGHKASDWNVTAQMWKMAPNGGDKADGWYAALGVPVWRWVKVYAKYDAYRDYATMGTLHSIYSLSAQAQPHKNLMLQVQYNYNDDKTSAAPERHYNQFWVQTYVRF